MRIVICGAISQYNNTTAVQGPKNYLSLLVNRARMEQLGAEKQRQIAEQMVRATAALERDDLAALIICPSNPYLSVDPILAVPGVPEAVAANTVVVPPNDLDLLERTLKADPQIGAVILEPTGGSFGRARQDLHLEVGRPSEPWTAGAPSPSADSTSGVS